ncbi:unnamed protein product [Amoebophrya sp. A25]|nr:unnamed protein product [Amoebophrya sp. A25]|eukprot:GSA25T00019241001.1
MKEPVNPINLEDQNNSRKSFLQASSSSSSEDLRQEPVVAAVSTSASSNQGASNSLARELFSIPEGNELDWNDDEDPSPPSLGRLARNKPAAGAGAGPKQGAAQAQCLGSGGKSASSGAEDSSSKNEAQADGKDETKNQSDDEYTSDSDVPLRDDSTSDSEMDMTMFHKPKKNVVNAYDLSSGPTGNAAPAFPPTRAAAAGIIGTGGASASSSSSKPPPQEGQGQGEGQRQQGVAGKEATTSSSSVPPVASPTEGGAFSSNSAAPPDSSSSSASEGAVNGKRPSPSHEGAAAPPEDATAGAQNGVKVRKFDASENDVRKDDDRSASAPATAQPPQGHQDKKSPERPSLKRQRVNSTEAEKGALVRKIDQDADKSNTSSSDSDEEEEESEEDTSDSEILQTRALERASRKALKSAVKKQTTSRKVDEHLQGTPAATSSSATSSIKRQLTNGTTSGPKSEVVPSGTYSKPTTAVASPSLDDTTAEQQKSGATTTTKMVSQLRRMQFRANAPGVHKKLLDWHKCLMEIVGGEQDHDNEQPRFEIQERLSLLYDLFDNKFALDKRPQSRASKREQLTAKEREVFDHWTKEEAEFSALLDGHEDASRQRQVLRDFSPRKRAHFYRYLAREAATSCAKEATDVRAGSTSSPALGGALSSASSSSNAAKNVAPPPANKSQQQQHQNQVQAGSSSSSSSSSSTSLAASLLANMRKRENAEQVKNGDIIPSQAPSHDRSVQNLIFSRAAKSGPDVTSTSSLSSIGAQTWLASEKHKSLLESDEEYKQGASVLQFLRDPALSDEERGKRIKLLSESNRKHLQHLFTLSGLPSESFLRGLKFKKSRGGEESRTASNSKNKSAASSSASSSKSKVGLLVKDLDQGKAQEPQRKPALESKQSELTATANVKKSSTEPQATVGIKNTTTALPGGKENEKSNSTEDHVGMKNGNGGCKVEKNYQDQLRTKTTSNIKPLATSNSSEDKPHKPQSADDDDVIIVDDDSEDDIDKWQETARSSDFSSVGPGADKGAPKPAIGEHEQKEAEHEQTESEDDIDAFFRDK